MLDNVTEPLTLDDLARRASMSKWHFQRLFRLVTGSSVRAFVRTLRLAVAAESLAESDELVGQIARKYQFGSHEGFSRAFSARYEKSPVEYRRSAQENLSLKEGERYQSHYMFLRFFLDDRGDFRLSVRSETLPESNIQLELNKHLLDESTLIDEGISGPAGIYFWHEPESDARKKGVRGAFYTIVNKFMTKLLITKRII